ncbi:MAG: nucleotide exchange factor GrpE [Candidatus Nomurabacteria bacterium]|nr:nucleotide exchange factor GrpE [Candidatus Nomurabacteria bacterium]USN87920.1 MAG: nucleotide exchange factor GrpE [Candidatus Nomurabacteria bacterium]
MVNKSNEDKSQDDVEITNEETDVLEPDLEEIENNEKDIIKSLKVKLKACNEEKREILEEGQRAKADFLNARRRLEEERLRDRVRSQKKHIEELLPLCDSFQMAMSDKEAWEKADKAWRTGIEGIHGQLMRLLESYGVKVINPAGEKFDPYRDEAIGTEEVDDDRMVDTVVSVVQHGYEMKVGDQTEVIRHARVTTGILKG